MEEEKAAAYYEELCRKGEGAAKFKQGLGFSSSSSSDPQKKSSFSSSSSLFSSFVRASSPKKLEEEERKRNHSQVLDKIRSQLNSSSSAHDQHRRRRSNEDDGYRRGRGRDGRDRERSRSRDRDRERRRRSRSRSRDRDGDRKRRDRDGSSRRKDERGGVDYSQLIDGYSKMAPAERVKAKMKLQLSQTAAKDTTMGMSTGWERFNFNKDAPLDEEEDDQVEVAADDSLIKGIGKSFRFSAVEAKREEELQAAHDQAMFGGASAASPVLPLEPIRTAEEDEKDDDKKVDSDDNHLSSSLMSDKVLSMQQGSWRDRARRFQNGS